MKIPNLYKTLPIDKKINFKSDYQLNSSKLFKFSKTIELTYINSSISQFLFIIKIQNLKTRLKTSKKLGFSDCWFHIINY